jgi:uncharacterized membrane protein
VRIARRLLNPRGDDETQVLVRLGLGLFMLGAGWLHLTAWRTDFEQLVPGWVPGSAASVVVVSGLVEIGLGAACWLLPHRRRQVGLALAVFYVLVFPGNLYQYFERTDTFGLDTDTLRLERLFFQPVLVVAAVWAAGLPKVGKRRSR